MLNLLQTCYTPEREKEEGESTLGAPASPPSRAREPRGSCQPLYYEHSCQPIHYLQYLPYDFGCQPFHYDSPSPSRAPRPGPRDRAGAAHTCTSSSLSLSL